MVQNCEGFYKNLSPHLAKLTRTKIGSGLGSLANGGDPFG